MASIAWSESTPANDATASGVDDILRSDTTAIAVGFGESFYWPGSAAQAGSAGSTGHTLPGVLRLSRSSNLDVVGQRPLGTLSWTTRRDALWHVGSSRTHIVGHSEMLEHVDFPYTAGATQVRWVVQQGEVAGTNFEETIAFPTAYAGIPLVLVGISSASFTHGVHSVTVSNFVSRTSFIHGGAVPSHTRQWRSIGTVTVT